MATLIIGPRRLAFLLTVGTTLTFFVIWFVWTVISRGVFTGATCPGCGSQQIRQSITSKAEDKFLRLFLIGAYRCKGCGLRHRNFRFVSLSNDGKSESSMTNSRSEPVG